MRVQKKKFQKVMDFVESSSKDIVEEDEKVFDDLVDTTLVEAKEVCMVVETVPLPDFLTV